MNEYFGTSIGRGDLTGAYAGVRPLISTGDPKKSVDISRKAELYETSSGMLTITGGKLTTWRRMAKLVVDRVAMREGREVPCRTADIPLGMAAGPEDLEPPSGVDLGPLPEGFAKQLAFRYGHASRVVLAIAAERPELARPIVHGHPDLLAEAVVAARLEQARTVGDVLLRRTRLALVAAPQLRDADSVMGVAAALGAELGWDAAEVRAAAEAWPGSSRPRARIPLAQRPEAGPRVGRAPTHPTRRGGEALRLYPSPPNGPPRDTPPSRPACACRRARHRALSHASSRRARRGDPRTRPGCRRGWGCVRTLECCDGPPAEAESSGSNREGDGDRPAPRRRRRRAAGRGRRLIAGAAKVFTDQEDDSDGDQDTGEPVSGVLDITPRGHGFIRLSGLEAAEEDVYVSPSQIRRCEMQRGDEVAGPARQPRRGERYPALIHVDTINGVEPGGDRLRLTDATPVHPTRRIELPPAEGASETDVIALRAFDLLCAPAHGQRILIKAAAGSGRTSLLRAIAAPLAGREDLELVVLLVDERPEEVAAWRDAAPGAELAIATADMRPGEQLRLVELAIGHATRRAESGADVVLLVDSISRIAVAADDPGRVKPLFGAGRETAEEDLGALTVIATALTDGEDEGGVKEALETTESALLVLDRDLAAAGVFPAVDVAACRISGEEHIRDESELAAIRALRAELGKLPTAEAAAALRKRIEGSADNAALLAG